VSIIDHQLDAQVRKSRRRARETIQDSASELDRSRRWDYEEGIGARAALLSGKITFGRLRERLNGLEEVRGEG